jgi:hypothetical protein
MMDKAKDAAGHWCGFGSQLHRRAAKAATSSNAFGGKMPCTRQEGR